MAFANEVEEFGHDIKFRIVVELPYAPFLNTDKFPVE